MAPPISHVARLTPGDRRRFPERGQRWPRTDVEAFVEPCCPWAWVTSRWVVQVVPQRDLAVTWRSYCLEIRGDYGVAPTVRASRRGSCSPTPGGNEFCVSVRGVVAGVSGQTGSRRSATSCRDHSRAEGDRDFASGGVDDLSNTVEHLLLAGRVERVVVAVSGEFVDPRRYGVRLRCRVAAAADVSELLGCTKVPTVPVVPVGVVSLDTAQRDRECEQFRRNLLVEAHERVADFWLKC
jgi:hypothetical protein